MKTKKTVRWVLYLLLAAFGIGSLGGCILVVDHGHPYHHRHGW